MRVLIQNARTREYLAAAGAWTPAPGEAEDFRMSLRAYDMARKRNIEEFRVVFYFPETESSIHILKGKCPPSPRVGV